MRAPSLDDILLVCGRASFGDYAARVEVPPDAPDEPLTVLAHALNILLGDLQHRTAQLEESEAKFRRLAESNIIGVIVGDLSGPIVEANAAFLALVGRPSVEGLRWQDITPPGWEAVDAAMVAELAANGVSVPREKEYVRPDGTRVPVMVGCALLPGSSTRAIAFVLDLTDQRRARAEAEASRERYRALFDHNPQPMYVVDMETLRILAVNQAMVEAYGWSQEEFARMTMLDIRPPSERERLLRTLPTVPPKMVANGVWRHLRKDGSTMDVEITTDRLVFDGRPARIVLVQDVSARLAAERELEAARRRAAQSEKLAALGSLVSGVAHEIRTPLAYIANFSSALEARVARGETEGLADMTREIRAGVERINTLVQGLSRFTRRQARDARTIRLASCVAEAVDLFEATHRTTGTVERDLACDAEVVADEAEIQQVVLNLLQNGADAVNGAGRLHVAVRAVAEGVEIAVRDEGPGIPPEVRARVFEPLFTTKAHGMGLGLAIAKRIVAEHGATLDFDTGPRGTTFRVLFPRRVEVADAAAPALAP